MIYTLTLNPALDYIVTVDDFEEGKINRTSSEKLLYGGKGINTSVVLTNTDTNNVALGFVGGNIGKEFEKLLNEDGVKTDFVYLKNSSTRINVKIKGTEETDINASGPGIEEDEINKLFSKLDNLKEGDYITLAGSIPRSIPYNIYVDIAKMLSEKKVNIVVDAEKNFLTDVLPYKPFLIKPNHHELGGIFNKEITTKEDVLSAAIKLRELGARNIFVSMAKDGGVFLSENKEAYFAPAPEGKVVNSTGAGDSLVAGFLSEYIRSGDFKSAFVMGLCAGSASAFSENLATKDEIEVLYNNFDFSKVELL